jgi:phage baseplate assembly protein W
MIGVSRQTGKALSGIEHLKQSIIDILLTPLGTRVMRREYGSRLFELIDAPINAGTIIEIVAATAEALDKWEPRIVLERVELADSSTTVSTSAAAPISESLARGCIGLILYGKYLPDGQPIKLDGIIL